MHYYVRTAQEDSAGLDCDRRPRVGLKCLGTVHETHATKKASAKYSDVHEFRGRVGSRKSHAGEAARKKMVLQKEIKQTCFYTL